jgi:hypothetical protein
VADRLAYFNRDHMFDRTRQSNINRARTMRMGSCRTGQVIWFRHSMCALPSPNGSFVNKPPYKTERGIRGGRVETGNEARSGTQHNVMTYLPNRANQSVEKPPQFLLFSGRYSHSARLKPKEPGLRYGQIK